MGDIMSEYTVVSEFKIVCPMCKGEGASYVRVSSYEAEKVKCSYCNGKRVVSEQKIHKKV